MQRLDRILAVVDPTSDVQAGVAKAARLASACGAALELLVCDFDPALTGQPFFDTDALHRLREEFIAERAEYLEGLAKELRTRGLEVTTHVHWDNPLHHGILRRVDEFTPDLVVKDTHHHPVLRRTLLSNTDWTLIRRCPVPLLLAKSRPWPDRLRIVAAVDPNHQADKPATLDHDLVDAAAMLAGQLGGHVEIVHAFFPSALMAATAGMAGMPVAVDYGATDLLEEQRSLAGASVHALAARHGLAREHVRIVQGSAVDALNRVVTETRTDLVVMGAVSRSRVRELFVGSTAERVLDRLPCDVLVLKPADFSERLPF